MIPYHCFNNSFMQTSHIREFFTGQLIEMWSIVAQVHTRREQVGYRQIASQLLVTQSCILINDLCQLLLLYTNSAN